jgi:hypothetical protein
MTLAPTCNPFPWGHIGAGQKICRHLGRPRLPRSHDSVCTRWFAGRPFSAAGAGDRRIRRKDLAEAASAHLKISSGRGGVARLTSFHEAKATGGQHAGVEPWGYLARRLAHGVNAVAKTPGEHSDQGQTASSAGDPARRRASLMRRLGRAVACSFPRTVMECTLSSRAAHVRARIERLPERHLTSWTHAEAR